MISYAGIGSRDITDQEQKLIHNIAKTLVKKEFIVYSGNADGADISFQKGSGGQCVIMLPWSRFNQDHYDPNKSLNYYVCGNSIDGCKSIDIFHPNPKALSSGARALMARNWHQIAGFGKYPKVSFVIVCADRDMFDNIKGGSGQACRIAKEFGIPIFNIRDPEWKPQLLKFVKGILYEKRI